MVSKDTVFQGEIKTSYMDSTPWWPEERKPPKDAPNVLYILLDDTGYSQVGCFGSPIETPNIDSLAADGMRYRDFHVCAMCSPTRASLLTGCNNHTVGFGYLSNHDLGFPSLRGEVDPKYGFISETLQNAGYFTCALGKWHLLNDPHMTGAGPFDQWPCGRGFDKYYGFLHGAVSQYNPELVEGNQIIDPPKLPEEGYQLGGDLVDKAISYIGDQKSCAPDKPFFCYLAFGAMHGPHHAPKEYIDRYKGKFDEGWDVYREKVLERQKAMGLVPQDTVLTERNNMVLSWDGLTKQQKKVLARHMEVFAGYLTYTDEQIGRLLEYLKNIQQYENTLIVFLTDNGASAEGGPNGCFNEYYHIYTMKWEDPLDDELLEKLGSVEANGNYPTGWAWAGNTPLKWYKSWVHAGGIKVPCILSYPKMIRDKGAICKQFHYVTDINATVLDICGIQQPEMIKGAKQEPKHGISMRYSLDDPEAPRRRKVQYFELEGNRGIWKDGWKAVANHVDSPSFDDDIWELYDTDHDFSESNDLASAYPDKLEELKALWWHEAGKYDVLPMIESHFRTINGYDFNHLFKAPPSTDVKHYTFYPQLMPSHLAPHFGNKSFTVTAHIDWKTGDEGVLVGAGKNVGGFTLYIEDGKLKYHYNFMQQKWLDLEYDKPLTEGRHDVTFEFVKTAKDAGTGRLLVDGRTGGEKTISSVPLFPAPGTFAVGRYGESPVNSAHRDKGYYRYTGTFTSIDIDMERPADDVDMTIKMEQALTEQ